MTTSPSLRPGWRHFLRDPRWRGIGLGLLCGLFSWLLAQVPLLRGLEDWALDACFTYRGSRPTGVKIVLVGLDEQSLDELNKPSAFISPELAEVVNHAHRNGARAIGLDVFVPASFFGLRDIAEPDGVGSARDLGKAILDAKNVVLPMARDGDHWRHTLPQWRIKAVRSGDGLDLGFVNWTEDGDQFIRRQQMLVRYPDEERTYPHFALALHARATGVDADGIGAAVELLPLDAEGKLRINFVGPAGSFPAVPLRKVLADARAGRDWPEARDAIVLVGATATSLQDYHATPYANHYARYAPGRDAGLMAGTEVHAHILATLADGAYVTTPWWLASLPWVLGMGAALGAAFARLSLERGFVLAVGHHFAWKGVALAAFTWGAWRVGVVDMLLMGALTYGLTFAWRWRTLRRAFGVVKSEAVALAIEADPRRLDPGGEERELSVLFADVRGFTDFSENHTAHQVVALLNAYFAKVVPEIEAEGGTVLTYLGDGLMVLFGAPIASADHAARATRAAANMVRAVHAHRHLWEALGNPDFRIGVGVHTGNAVVGAVGSPGRLDYTAIGDTINTAARIESENKNQGTEILLSDATVAGLTPEGAKRLGVEPERRAIRVKGKQQELFVHALFLPDEVSSGKPTLAPTEDRLR